jgi:FkbH-like protein
VTSQDPSTELLYGYIQTDVRSRAPLHKQFHDALRACFAEQGPRAARAWARRAVSPLLDYSSLMALRRYLPLRTADDTEPPLRLAILGGPTTIQLRHLIEVFLAAEGVVAEIYESDYGVFRQEILSPDSELNAFRPVIVFLATSARDVIRAPSLGDDEAAVALLADEEAAGWAQLWETASARWNATIIQNNFEIAPGSVFGHQALRLPAARENYLERLNRLLAARAPQHVVFHDLRGLAAEAGAHAWFDPRFYFEAKMPCGAASLVAYGHSVVSIVRAVLGRSRKVLVLDLDNTLWGGVVGDQGAGGITLGEGSSEGEAFLAFQRHAKLLRDRGVVLAVCSKNDEGKAREPFEQRADMVLRLSDIACFVANWQNKADNLRAIAERLAVGLDSLVLVDDNPAERALVRRLAPEVAVPDMPDDPAGFSQALMAHRYFETVAFTPEDLARARYYAANAKRRAAAAQSTDIDAYLASLRMRMKVAPVSELNIERVTQLINKSNQFNLTTRRFTVAQVRELANSADWRTLTFSLRDTMGDNGLISVILLSRDSGTLQIDTWLMSCRVLARGVEQFARNALVELARREGIGRLEGVYIPTARNGMVAQHYAGLGFAPAGTDDGQTFWTLGVVPDLPALPHHIEHG